MRFAIYIPVISLLINSTSTSAFVTSHTTQLKCSSTPDLKLYMKKVSIKDMDVTSTTSSLPNTRKGFFLASIITASATISALPYVAKASEIGEEDNFASIAAKAASIAKKVEKEEDVNTNNPVQFVQDDRTIYDFSLPIGGESVPLMELTKQEFKKTSIPVKTKLNEDEVEQTTDVVEAKVKAILVVNIKQDDPIARQNIPELISLASKFGRTGEFVVICSPTDQGYFEPDTSALIRLKLASEYGYGINPVTIITDKVNVLGTGCHPLWRWIEGTCRAPSGLGRIQGNFEKFLVDGRTGKAIRRYPRKYQPFDIVEDIDATMKGRSLPPAGANWKEEWRNSDKDAEKDTYRFQKGLNVFDQ